MEDPALPTEIITIIALIRPDAYNKLIQSCKKMFNILSSYRDELLKKWIRRYNRMQRFLKYGYKEMKVYAGVCPNGTLHGEYKIFDIDRNKVIEVHNYKFGVLHGKWYSIDNYNYRISANFEDGLLHGFYKFTGGGYKLDLVTTHYVRGKRHGLHEGQYISGGKRFSINYLNGRKEGEATYYYPDTNRVCCREYYCRDKLHGERIFYSYKGDIVRKDVWDYGVMIDISISSSKWRENPRIDMDLHEQIQIQI
jgi:antitoxin component YwqK of YwqJK toxin-antitoxin module